jgi:Ca2+-binding EF-hand superfamily protein
MRPIDRSLALGLAGVFLVCSAPADDKAPDPKARSAAPAASASPDSVQDLIFLGDNRPIFLRLRMTLGPRAFRVAWKDSVKAMHSFLDRDGNGTVTKEEADKGALATLVRVANGGATAMPRGDLDVHPRDGVVSIDELSDALRTALGPFRVQVGKLASGKTDALFGHLDRDKDGKLTRAELVDAASSLHRLDLDDDELIEGIELEPFTDPSAMQMENIPGRRGNYADAPPVVELMADDSSLRPVRQLLKKYDKGTGKGASPGDNKLTNGEFAIDPKTFARADADSDGALDTEELRRFLAKAAPDIELAVGLSADASGTASVAVAGGSSQALPPWARVKQLGGGDVEISADEIRLEVHVDDGAGAVADARRTFTAQFEAADSDNNGYVEKSEVTKDKDHPSPLAGLFDILDRDGDGKLYPKELGEFVDRQAEAARDRMVLTASDQGRAIFSILDLNRDRRLGIREVRGTLDRVATWDRDGDSRITAEEIPHHYQLTVARGHLAGIGNANAGFAGPMNAPADQPVAAGPNWFRRMDRNRDGDVSSREFRGPRAQFDRLDRDKDGLIDATEAAAPTATASAATKPSGK